MLIKVLGDSSRHLLIFYSFVVVVVLVACGKFPCQGLNLSHSRDLSHFSDNAGSLTHCATRELLIFYPFKSSSLTLLKQLLDVYFSNIPP